MDRGQREQREASISDGGSRSRLGGNTQSILNEQQTMSRTESTSMVVDPQFTGAMREIGLDADAVFEHRLITPWRKLDDRENCTLNTRLDGGQTIKWHVKRYTATDKVTPAKKEVAGLKLLRDAGIATATLVAWGQRDDRSSFVVFDHLDGFDDTEKLLQAGQNFTPLLRPTAELAAKLHRAGLHHRDLYLCHFFSKVAGKSAEVRLIDTARVKKLPKLLRRRWIVKDLAQFWYSTLATPITDAQREQWLAIYLHAVGKKAIEPLRRSILAKVARIAKHDQKLRHQQPGRNVSIPR
jgi:hypothetical protein